MRRDVPRFEALGPIRPGMRRHGGAAGVGWGFPSGSTPSGVSATDLYPEKLQNHAARGFTHKDEQDRKVAVRPPAILMGHLLFR